MGSSGGKVKAKMQERCYSRCCPGRRRGSMALASVQVDSLSRGVVIGGLSTLRSFICCSCDKGMWLSSNWFLMSLPSVPPPAFFNWDLTDLLGSSLRQDLRQPHTSTFSVLAYTWPTRSTHLGPVIHREGSNFPSYGPPPQVRRFSQQGGLGLPWCSWYIPGVSSDCRGANQGPETLCMTVGWGKSTPSTLHGQRIRTAYWQPSPKKSSNFHPFLASSTLIRSYSIMGER